MMSLSLRRSTPWGWFNTLWNARSPNRSAAAAPEDMADESRNRRAFFQEMLERHPDAFRSEMDVEHLARLYRCKF